MSSNIGRYGPYLTYRNENFRLPKSLDPLKMTLGEAVAVIENTITKKNRARKKQDQ